MKRINAVGLALAFVAVASAGCKKEPEKVVMSCVVSFQGDNPSQCFEYTSEVAKKPTFEARCKEFEGKTAFREGPCPAEGRGGKCVTRILEAESVMVCYRDTESCRKSCDGENDTFTPN